MRAEQDRPADPGGTLPQVRPDLRALARRIHPSASWDDLILPEDRVNVLREIALHARHGLQIEDGRTTGVRSTRRAASIRVLFAGPAGTGRKLAAKVIACELRNDLYLVNLATILTGSQAENEKNLRHLFVTAAQGRAVLLFDDAANFFDKATGLSSHLLRNMQEVGGLIVLVTETSRAIPESFQRKLDFVLSFPFPDAAQREQIWRRVLPPQVPTEGLDLARLARVELPGSHIRDIAHLATFLAAELEQPVSMQHLRRAADSLHEKLGLTMSLSDFQYWL